MTATVTPAPPYALRESLEPYITLLGGHMFFSGPTEGRAATLVITVPVRSPQAVVVDFATLLVPLIFTLEEALSMISERLNGKKGHNWSNL